MIHQTKYKSDSGFVLSSVFILMVKDLPRSFWLGLEFAKRNLKAKYRKSFLGIFWAFIPPLANASIWILLQKQGIFKFPDIGVPYPVFVLCGTFFWQVFSTSITLPIQVFQSNQSILTKINFPRESLFFAAFFELLLNVTLSFIVVLIVLFCFGIDINFHILYFLPYFFGLMLLGMAFSLFIIPFGLLFTDIIFALPFLLQFGMYLSPVIYPKIAFSGIASILEYNPVSPFLIGARNSLLGLEGSTPLFGIFIGILLLLTLIIVGLIIMRIIMRILIERMGS